MKPKKTTPSRRKFSFAVDRDEIEVNSDWVEAVMASSPAATTGNPAIEEFPVPSVLSDEAGTGVFFATGANNATVAKDASDAWCSSVEISASVENKAPVVEDATVVLVEDRNAGGELATLAGVLEVRDPSSPDARVDKNTPVSNNATVARTANCGQNRPKDETATGTKKATVELHAVATPPGVRRRPLRRVTDGMTPGQFAVYRLMYEAGERAGDRSRIYRGGYADLMRLTGMSKRGIQNAVAELQHKSVIRIHQRPGHHRTQTSAYMVPDDDGVLQSWSSQGWRYAVGKSKALVS